MDTAYGKGPGLQEKGSSPGKGNEAGKIAVIGGKAIVTNPQGKGRFAVIQPGASVQIFVNGKRITQAVAVGAGDKIQILPEKVEPQKEIKVRVSPDQMAAFVTVFLKKGQLYEIEDHPPAATVTVQAKQMQELKAEVTKEEVLQALKAEGVVFGIQEESISQAIINAGKETQVAWGKPPQKGKDAEVHYFFGEKEASEKAGFETYREIISVDPGTVIGKISPPLPGKPGQNVYGQPVFPPPPKDAILRAGKGVELREDGKVAVATAQGRPEIKGNLLVIQPTYVINGDATPKEGHIKFKGDVVVRGNVLDGTKIEATGKVVVHGYVANAKIFAGSGVNVQKSLVSSTVEAGGSALSAKVIVSNLEETLALLEGLRQALKQLRAYPSFSQLPLETHRLILLKLREKKFPGLFKELREKIEKLQKEEERLAAQPLEIDLSLKDTITLLEKLTSSLGSVHLQSSSIEKLLNHLEDFFSQAQALAQALSYLAAQPAEIVASYAQNSSLASSGKVKITGKGCYHSVVYAGEEVLITGVPGVFSGGELSAGGDVQVCEAGTPTETPTHIRTTKGHKIKIQRAHPGVYLHVGEDTQKIDRPANLLEFRGK